MIQRKTTGYALSEAYQFKIVPRRGSIIAELDSVQPVTGALFCPPANVKASKGISSDSITIEWDTVQNASSYNIYRTSIDSSENIDSYEYVVNVTGNSYEDRSVNSGEYAYVVTSVKSDSTESLKQDPASSEYPFPMEVNMYNEEEKSNVGYPLMAPSQLVVSSVKGDDGKYAESNSERCAAHPRPHDVSRRSGAGGNRTLRRGRRGRDLPHSVRAVRLRHPRSDSSAWKKISRKGLSGAAQRRTGGY